MERERYFVHAPEGDDHTFDGVLFALWHGAGGDVDERSLVHLAQSFAARGGVAARARFPYRVAGKKLPDRMPKLVASMRETIAELRARHPAVKKVVLGGRSMGGRTASMLAAEGDAVDALVFLAYPLHPEGKEAQLRDAHLPDVRCPMLFVQGDRDALANLELLRPVIERNADRAELALHVGADHSLKKVKPEALSEEVLTWLARKLG
ncbi:dienelactone hydrolase family protein [Myxococcota bacterium]|nr:dienelactone hydrolase family protein [Myxococcota bacterium]